MLGRSHQTVLGQRYLHVDRAGEERTLGADYQLARVERLLDRAVGRSLRDLAQLGCGRVLPLSQTVYLVVEQYHVQVDITAYRVYEVVTADSQRVAVAGADPYRQIGIGRLDTGGHGIGAAVYRVETEGLHIVDEARRAADARDEGEEVVRRVGGVRNFGQCALHGVQDGVVAAARAPAHLLVALEIRRGIVVACHNRLLQ